MFDFLLEDINYVDAYQPLVVDKDDRKDDNDLWNPKGRAVCLILYLYSMEPPFYAGLNKACRNKDDDCVEMLGPFATAIFWILSNAERERVDRMQDGEVYGRDGPIGFFGGSFLLFRFVYMKEEWINQWEDAIGRINKSNGSPDTICLPENTSTSLSLKEAIHYGKSKSLYTGMHHVLFVFSI